jgi:putative transposase
MKFAPQETRTFQITAVTAQRRRLFQVTSTATLFVDTLQENREKKRFELHAFVVMPDHVHLLLTPAFDIPLEKAVQFIKGGFSFKLKSKMDVWERGYDNRRITDALHFDVSKRYIEENPVRARMVTSQGEFPFSSCAKPEMVDPTPPWFGQG